MTTIPATDSWFRRTTRSIHIPPVYLFLIVIFLVSGLLDQIYSDGQILYQPGDYAEYHRPVGCIGNCGSRTDHGDPGRHRLTFRLPIRSASPQ